MRSTAVKLLAVVALAACAPFTSTPVQAAADNANVVAVCGTPNSTYTAGTDRPLTQDLTGTLCSTGSGGGGGGGTSSNFGAAFPAAGTAVGFKDSTGTNMAAGNLTAAGAVKADTTSVNGVTTLTGAGATGTGAQRVTAAQDTTTIAGAAPLTTGVYVTGPSAAALATSANQSTGNTSLGTIATNTGTTATGIGAPGDSACATDNGTCSAIALIKRTNQNVTTLNTTASGAIPAGTNIIGKVGIDQTTPGTTNGVQVNAALPAGSNIIGNFRIDQTTPGTTNGVQVNAALPAGTNVIGKTSIDQTTPGTTNAIQEIPGTAGGLTISTFEPAASDNHTNLKNGAGQVYWVTAFNNSATINYLRFYNAASGFNGCNSATNLVAVVHIPANTSDAGFVLNVPTGMPFSTGISYCVVSAYGQATTTNATASAIDINIGYK